MVNIQHLDIPALNNMLDSLLAQQQAAQQSHDRNLQIVLSQQTATVQAHVTASLNSQQEVSRIREQSAQAQAQASADLFSQQQRTHVAEHEALRAKTASEAQAALAQAQQNTANVEQQATVLLSQANPST